MAIRAVFFLCLAIVASYPSVVSAQAANEEEIRATVTAITPDGVYLDQGRDSGVAVGDSVSVIPLAGASLTGTVRLVSSQAARVEIPGGPEGVQVGDRASILIAAQRSDAKVTPEDPAPPPHPPWTAEEGEWPEDAPLLAPVASRGPEERDREYRGRMYLRGESGTDDNAGSDWSLLWAGARLDVDNPFGRGGELHLDLDAYQRSFDDDDESESDTRLRIDRLAWAVGGDRTRPDRFEIGRFLHESVPEFGVLDGVAWERRLPSGDRVGASLGFLADWDDGAGTGNNAGVQAWYRYVGDDDGTISSTIGAQKTWFEGDADRDLLVWTGDWRPGARTSMHGSLWLDLYGGADTKSGTELTQALLTATHRFESGDGLTLTATRYAWPDLLRDDLFVAGAEDLLDGEVTRISLRGWHDLNETVRLDGRVSTFSDQDESGGSFELGATARDWLWSAGSTSLHLFHADAKYSSGPGLRASASKRFDAGRLRFDLDVADYDGEALGDGSLASQRLRASWDMDLFDAWSLSLSAEARSGDQEDSRTLGFYLQRRF